LKEETIPGKNGRKETALSVMAPSDCPGLVRFHECCMWTIWPNWRGRGQSVPLASCLPADLNCGINNLRAIPSGVTRASVKPSRPIKFAETDLKGKNPSDLLDLIVHL
jgi:hypothetical protein